MSRIAEARGELVAALEVVLPGRVFPYPQPTAPGIWLGVAVPGDRQQGNTRFLTARFPLTIAYDGADKAQVAGLDEVTAKVCDVIEATSGFRRLSARADTEKVGANVYQAVVIDVEAVLDVRTFCVPAPQAAQVPNPPIVEKVA